MAIEKLSSLVSRVCYFGAFGLLCVAIVEKIANLSKHSVLTNIAPDWAGRADRLLEFAVILNTFLIALLLRQIREALKAGGPART